MQALIGVSLDNRNYSTTIVSDGLRAVMTEYSKITFLVADQIQIFNRVAAASNDLPFVDSMSFSGIGRREFEERRNWLQKLRSQIAPREQKWAVLSVDDVADSRAYALLRAIRILFVVDKLFQHDVREAAEHFAHRHPDRDLEIARSLSVQYILEEVALNIRLRAVRRIYDEFYFGDTFPIFLNLYRDKYSKSVGELAGIPSLQGRQFRFFEWVQPSKRWRMAPSGASPRLKVVGSPG